MVGEPQVRVMSYEAVKEEEGSTRMSVRGRSNEKMRGDEEGKMERKRKMKGQNLKNEEEADR